MIADPPRLLPVRGRRSGLEVRRGHGEKPASLVVSKGLEGIA